MERESGEFWMESAGERGRKKRFSDEQIKSLELMFGSETKLDPRKKQQLASELGMQPRQVAIWFQNKRARWKSKQLEREYGVLRADYEDLRVSYELLKKEKQMLSKQHQMLMQQLEEPVEEKIKYCDSNNPDEEYPRESPLIDNSDSRVPMHSVDSEKNLSYDFREEETELYLGLTSNDFSSSSEKQFYLDPSLSSDQSCNNSQWWEFWPI